jgi:diguanylate cyclase (GGDEF)-like protein
MVSVLSNGLVLTGIAILAYSLFDVRKVIECLPSVQSRKYWYVMAGFIVFFIVGYFFYLAVIYGKGLTNGDLIVPGIFFFGACFVRMSTGLALQTAVDVRRIAQLEREIITDPLTGAFNRRFLHKRLAEEVSKARRYHLDLAVLMLDLDNFKQLNDLNGHQVGDQLLIQIHNLMRDELRDSDVLARFGGEEFLVIAPNTKPTDANLLAERLRVSVEKYRPAPENPMLRVTISIGVASFDKNIVDQESLIRIADKNLYLAKERGRNQVASEPSVKTG